MNRAWLWFMALLISPFVLPPAVCSAADYVDKQGPATLRIHATRLESGQPEIRLCDALSITISVEGTSPFEVGALQAPTPSTDWEIDPGSRPEKSTLPERTFLWQQMFRARPVRAGDISLPLATLSYRATSDEKWHEIAWKPIIVRVTTEIANPDLSELRDATPPEELPAVPSWQAAYVWLGLAIGLLVFLFTGWRLLRRQAPPQAPLPPGSWALGELDRIQQLPVDSEKAIERFHTELSNVIRRYLELRFQIPAPEQTTVEFLVSMRQSPHLGLDQQNSLRDLMERWDLVKFARLQASAEECHALAILACDFVEQTGNKNPSKNSDTITETKESQNSAQVEGRD